MSNDKHYPTHPGAEHPPIMTCEIPLEEYESLKRENERLNRELEHVKNGDCIYTCDVVEKHVKEELKAKRALCLAIAGTCREVQGGEVMTEREKDAYIEQLRCEVSKWHHAYDVLLTERNALAHELHKIKKTMTDGA